MTEALAACAAVGSAGMLHAAWFQRGVRRRLLTLVAGGALVAAIFVARSGAPDAWTPWLFPPAAWLAGFTVSISARPFAPRGTDLGAALLCAVGALGGVLVVLGGGRGA
ncbi:MAG: hypothetical protein V4850_31220 [Myxococcota bacterium]